MGDPNGVRICDGGCESAHNFCLNSPDVSRRTIELNIESNLRKIYVKEVLNELENVTDNQDLRFRRYFGQYSMF